jgi:hypothetical protein
VYGSGRLIERRPGAQATRHVFSNGDTNLPYLHFVARTSPEVQRRHGDLQIALNLPEVDADPELLEALASTIGRAMDALRAWLGDQPLAEQISLVSYSGDQCLGLGPLLLLGRFFRFPDRSIDATIMDLTSLRETVLHELAHLWFGGILTGAGEECHFLHETLASYMAIRLLDAVSGSEAALAARQRMARHCRTLRRRAASGEGPPRGTYRTRALAMQGALALHMLREHVGEEIFDASLPRFCRNYYGRSFGIGDLRTALAEGAAVDVGAFLDQWLSPEGSMPKLSAAVRPAPPALPGYTYDLTVTADRPLSASLPVDLRGDGRVTRAALRMDNEEAIHRRLTVSHSIDTVVVDPDGAYPIETDPAPLPRTPARRQAPGTRPDPAPRGERDADSASSAAPPDSTAPQYLLAIGSSSAGKRVMIWASLGVTITSSSMRAAETPSVAGQ